MYQLWLDKLCNMYFTSILVYFVIFENNPKKYLKYWYVITWTMDETSLKRKKEKKNLNEFIKRIIIKLKLS